MKSFTTCLYDEERGRRLPVAVYYGSEGGDVVPVLFSPGYDKRREENAHAYLDYGYIAEALTDRGFMVFSVRHDLETDPLLPMERPYASTRMSDWRKGEANLLFLVRALSALYSRLRWDRLVVMGHSNGGDISALFASGHPELVHMLVTLDNRRYPLPRNRKLKVLTVRGNDYPADPGVLPNERESAEYPVAVVRMENVGHSDIGQSGTAAHHQTVADILVENIHL